MIAHGKVSLAIAGLLATLPCTVGLQVEVAKFRAAPLKFHQRPRCPGVTSLRLRGGEEEVEKDTLITRLKNNRSLNPSDHANQLEWFLALVLAAYVAIGAPFSEYVPLLQDLVKAAEKERMEWNRIRQEQEEEFQKSLMEDSMKQNEQKKRKEEAEAAERAARKAFEEKVSRLPTEPEQGAGVVQLRFSSQEGFHWKIKSGGVMFDYVDVERYKKAEQADNAEEQLKELADLDYVLVSTIPKLLLSEREKTLKESGISSSCALMIKPVVADT
ncbi:hypothetical protein GUITHDRAFT_103785 [Guillardia theta CCMP2712]|uniref:UBX domain-containing protein n=1 Tax=Guillardia theta (strain CCMP2712) TaxID=905079 RepID=L1JR42_GUITC|nr:hypothetical protein GUITHDRAFT_103785 [Guillardia theta CCMP2712]EKX50558.1 hypothetical protein GUITHDRAFT_103785 [Guillardia theta CCMP2712]|eukprot:XP_005837538.1 hypothetical protein GUITHDRAFT_103785 [Guillardia theta CCMP2712]